MFRAMRHPNKQLSREECLQILINEPRGVLSLMGDDGYPYGVPMDHWYCEENGKLYFHCGKEGHKIDSLARSNKVSFCVMDPGTRKEGDWALYIRSVILFGRITVVEDPETVIDIIRKLSFKYTPDTQFIEEEIRKYGSEALCLELTPEHITGKLIHEA